MTGEALARQRIGAALDGTPGSCLCALCGESPHAPGRPVKQALGPNFTDYDQVVCPSSDVICDGCALMIGGKPGRIPPPLRLASFAVVSGELRRLGIDELAALLRGAAGVEVIGWAISRQKHASLRCGLCTDDRYLVGCDHGQIDWRPARDAKLLEAVASLRSVAMRDQILSGDYPPHVIAALGSSWAAHEQIVAEYRPGLHLELAVGVIRRPDITLESPPMTIPPEYRAAAELLGPLAYHAAARRGDPIRFWSELLPRRLSAASTSGSVLEWLSYLLRALDVDAFHPDVVAILESEIDDASVLSILRRDHRLLITIVRQFAAEESDRT